MLWGAELEDRQKTFKVLDWMVANGKARGPSRIENKLKDLVKRSQSSSAAEIAWILGADPTTPLLQLSQRALEASQRYHRLSSNLEIFGGHVKPIKEAGVEKEPLFAKVQCVSCRRTAGEAGLERIKRCSGCKSAAVAYCSAECQNTDFLGKNGVHGVRLQRRDRVTECKRNAAAIATFRT